MKRVFLALIVFVVALQHPAVGMSQESRDFLPGTVEITASGPWVFEQTGESCRLDLVASKQNINVVLENGNEAEFPIPRGTLSDDGDCLIHADIELEESTSYEFYINDVLVAEASSADLLSGDPVSIRLYELPEPTPTPTAEPTPESEYQSYGQFNEVTSAHTVSYTNINESTMFTEPVMLSFVNYEFANADAADLAMPDVCEFNEENHDLLAESDYLREVSIGRIGDDRCAFGVNFPDEATTLSVVVRVDNQVLTVLAIGLGGDYPEFVGEFLEIHLDDVSGNDRALLPELADMPRGWEAVNDIRDITSEVTDDD